MYQGVPRIEEQVAEIAAARLGAKLVDMDWQAIDFKDNITLKQEARMVNTVVDVVLAAYCQSETFGEGHDILGEILHAGEYPILRVVDDLYNWQSALAHIHGFFQDSSGLSGKRIAISWGFGSSFVNPSSAHALLLAATQLGANVRLVAPQDFDLLGRVKTEAKKNAASNGTKLEFRDSFGGAFDDVDAVFASNWLRLDDFSHPERFSTAARKYKDWYFDVDTLPSDCLFSQEPPLDFSLMTSSSLAQSEKDITSTYLSRRVRILAASIIHVTSLNLTDLLS
jgi:ornithine carbamoyltransferase